MRARTVPGMPRLASSEPVAETYTPGIAESAWDFPIGWAVRNEKGPLARPPVIAGPAMEEPLANSFPPSWTHLTDQSSASSTFGLPTCSASNPAGGSESTSCRPESRSRIGYRIRAHNVYARNRTRVTRLQRQRKHVQDFRPSSGSGVPTQATSFALGQLREASRDALPLLSRQLRLAKLRHQILHRLMAGESLCPLHGPRRRRRRRGLGL